jgi:hypothetical protein
MKMVHDERVKITAAFLNGIAIAVFVIGTFAPMVQSIWNAETRATDWSLTVLIGAICIGVSGALHFAARAVLAGLRE